MFIERDEGGRLSSSSFELMGCRGESGAFRDWSNGAGRSAEEARSGGAQWSHSKHPSVTLFLAVFSTGIGGTFQYGYNISIINAPTMYVQKFINETWEVRYSSDLDRDLLRLLWSIIVSSFTLGGFLGAWLGGPLAVRFGRKRTLLFINVIVLAGSALMGASNPAGTFELLIVGRLLVGLHSGVTLCVQPMYLGEIAPKALRGTISLGSSIAITAGILIGQVMGQRELLGGEEYWPILLSTSCIPAILQLLLLPWFPESPRYLFIDRKDEIKALQALRRFHNADSYWSELEDLERERAETQLQQSKQLCELLTDRSTRWQLVTIVILNVAQQCSGINAIYFYATYVFNEAGIAEAYIPYVTLGTGASECLSALCCGLLIERLGRRVLILSGYSLMALWCAAMTITLTYQASYSWVPYMTMTCLFAFILSFGLGPGGVTNTVTGELFTQSSRPAAYMISSSTNWICFFFISLVFPLIVEGLKHFCFLIFLAECLLVTLFIYIILPETKNRSFLDIEKEFQARNFKAGMAGGVNRDVEMSRF
ncbi:solute carrier family 2, facilitated glucose transporter member 11b isoform X1 [Scyliorhinus canicula]|uniref:solute carrier family 2, facilitated glucose transporter member 11b isoform X1 n=1 Tax=Scyliorhinus canicula TaxID=7830 RepID=UPI0018F7C89C|nr:solute carrier family 2, facilitated glucose transporter member 11b isoform X1 [Scyliorhinus canicula]